MATRLRAQLVAAGETQAAVDLEMAERSGVTSGEVISNVGVALQRYAQTGDPDRAGARDLASELDNLGRRMGDASNRGESWSETDA